MPNENAPKVVENPTLVDAITRMRAAYSVETQNTVINESLKATFLVPAVIEKDTQLVADGTDNVKFVDKPKAKFLLIKNKEGKTFFPCFTDKEQISRFKAEEKYTPVTMKFSDIANLTEKVDTVSGFVVNPMTQNLPFSKEMLTEIKRVLMKNREDAKKKAEEAAAATAEATEE